MAPHLIGYLFLNGNPSEGRRRGQETNFEGSTETEAVERGLFCNAGICASSTPSRPGMMAGPASGQPLS